MPDDALLPSPPPPLVALAGWFVPGAGYWLIGEKARAAVVCVTIVSTFLAGLLIGGIRVVDVPGYDREGRLKTIPVEGNSVLRVTAIRNAPMAEVFNKPWFIGQILAGPIAVAAGYASIEAASSDDVTDALAAHKPVPPRERWKDIPVPQSTSRVFDIGTLFAAVAGMLNLLVIIDGAYRAGQRHARRTTAREAA